MDFIEKFKKSEAGFTLMEVLFAMVLFSILSLTIASLLSNTISTSKRLTEKSMKLEDARIAMDFIQTQIKLADGFTINATNTQLTTTDSLGATISIFEFNNLSNSIEFGGNVLAKDVANFSIVRINDIVKIVIAMKPGKGYGNLKLVGEVNVKYKI